MSRSPNPNFPAYPEDRDGQRYCKPCKEWKLLEDFPWDKRFKVYKRKCKVCDNARRNKAYHDDPKQMYWAHVLRRYGLTKEQGEALWAAQDEKCGCCGAEHWGKGGFWHVEHDHATKKVRGIVCFHCNVMIAMARDSVDNLRAAIAYLERSRC